MSDSLNERYTYEDLEETANFLKEKCPSIQPKVAIMCGSGLSSLGDQLEDPVKIEFQNIPHFPKGTNGSLVFGCLAGVPVVLMRERYYFYDGYPIWKVTMPCRIFKLLGCSNIIVMNTAAGVNEKYNVGDVMIIKDHVYFPGFCGNHPLRGPNEDKFGERCPSLEKCYDMDLRKYGLTVANKLGLNKKFHEGVCASVGGPCFESVAEIRMLSTFGIDAVGVSSIPEIIVANHSGLTVFAFSQIIDIGMHNYDSQRKPTPFETTKAVKDMEEPLQKFINEMVKFIGSKKPCTCGSTI